MENQEEANSHPEASFPRRHGANCLSGPPAQYIDPPASKEFQSCSTCQWRSLQDFNQCWIGCGGNQEPYIIVQIMSLKKILCSIPTREDWTKLYFQSMCPGTLWPVLDQLGWWPHIVSSCEIHHQNPPIKMEGNFASSVRWLTADGNAVLLESPGIKFVFPSPRRKWDAGACRSWAVDGGTDWHLKGLIWW